MSGKTYIVEHLDPELEQWSAYEYKAIANESAAAGSSFYLTSVPTSLQLPPTLQDVRALQVKHEGVEELYAETKHRVCLLDPAAKKELSPEDAKDFDVFLFGGILGDDPPRGEDCFPARMRVEEADHRDRPHVGAAQEGVRGTQARPCSDDYGHRGADYAHCYPGRKCVCSVRTWGNGSLTMCYSTT